MVEVLVYSDQRNRLEKCDGSDDRTVMSSLYARFRANDLDRETSPQRIDNLVAVV